MTLLAPLALALGALAVPIVLMYVLKLRRQRLVVPSTLLWQRVLEDVQANAPWQRLRPTVLLLLQLLALAALVMAVARPAYTRTETVTGDLVVIVDESYEMQAHDVAPSRFAVALARAHDLASNLAPGNVLSVIGMAGQPRLVAAESSDQATIGHAIDGLQTGVSPPNFLAALSLASSLARSGEGTRVVVLTSRDSGITGLPVSVPFPVQIVRIGGRLHDLGITAFSAVHASGHTKAVLRVRNFGVRTASSDLDLLVDGQLADVRPVTLAPGQEQNLFWSELPESATRLHAHLERADDYSGDKTAWAVINGESTRNVLLITSGDYFLETALTLDPTVNLQTISSSDYAPDQASGNDLVVFDRYLPATLPATPVLLVSPPAGGVRPLQFGSQRPAGPISVASLTASDPLSSLLRYVDFSDVHVTRAREVALPSSLQPLVFAGKQPLIAAGPNGATRLGVISFDVLHSDWPLRVSFPIAVQNLLHYLAPGLALGVEDLSVGQAVSFFPDSRARVLRVTKPDGSIEELHAPFLPFTDTSEPGLYSVREIGQSIHASAVFAANFFHPPSAPAPGPAILSFGHFQEGYNHAVRVPVDFAWALGLVALSLLGLEWWLALRR